MWFIAFRRGSECDTDDRPLAARVQGATTDRMPTNTDLRDGERHDITIRQVSLRPLEIEGTTVHRLLVEDENGEQFPILTAPGSDTLVQLKTGDPYRVTDLLGADPPGDTDPDTTCPSCGSALRPGQAIDAVDEAVLRAAEELGIAEAFGIVDARTVIARLRTDKQEVDDWEPMTSGSELAVPDFVCDACGRDVPGHLATDGEIHAAEGQMDRSVDNAAPAMESPATTTDSIGLATGGAKDAENFRENVAAGYTPQPEAISDEGLFYDYYFETGESSGADADALFAPRYATAVSDHPLTGETEHYLSVGLDSTLSAADFERPRLDLVAVLDVSGSMDSPFDQYYYDEHGRKRETDADSTTKIEAATRSLCALTEQLRPEDRLGVVLYNNRAHVAKPLRDVASTNMVAIRQHVREVAAGGGTNLADGFEAAWDMLADGETTTDVERRVVFMTDMMPNTGATGERTLTRLFADAADRGIHTTFVGMGLDANADLADALSGIRGANHYFVHSAAEFERRLGAEFDYMVTPLVYDLELELGGAEIAAVHGSPTAEDATGRLMHVETLFPSAKEDGEARGGVVLVRLDGAPADGEVDLVASWTERDGSDHSERATVTLSSEPEQFDHDGIRKSVVLSRYARELRSWAREVHQRATGGEGVDDWLLPDQRGEHERESVPLAVSDDWAARFADLRAALRREREAVGDDDLQQEVTLLARLLEGSAESRNGVSK